MKKNRKIIIIILCIVMVLLIIAAGFLVLNLSKGQIVPTAETYTPSINPADFVSGINHKYLTFTPGTKFVYEGQTEEGTERVEV